MHEGRGDRQSDGANVRRKNVRVRERIVMQRRLQKTEIMEASEI